MSGDSPPDVNGGSIESGQRPTADLFSSALGTSFRLADGGGELELSSVTPLPPHGMRSDPFSLIFCMAGPAVLPQQIHRLEHDQLGELDIFLVPIGPDEQGRMRYEALFN